MDANGQLTFTRASDATRVGPNGYIEKVRENLFTYSTDFSNAAWSVPAVVTHGQPDPFGGNNASLVTFDAVGTSNIDNGLKSITSGVSYTISAWIKGVNVTGFRMLVADNKVINVTSQIVNGSWVRVSLTQTATATGSYQQQVARALNTNEESFYIYGAQVEVSDFGPTDLIVTQATPLSVGPVSGTPRLDYLNGECPSLLLEPQRTNLTTYSEQFDNAAWVKDGATITANATTSPDGYTNADLLTATTGQKRVYQTYTTTFGIDYTLSAFVKQGTSNSIQFVMPNVAGGPVFTFSTESFSTVSGWTASFDNYGNGWYRIKATRTSTSSNAGFQLVIPTDGQSVYVWGCGFEAGSYATSYIPTLGTAVTRVADQASKTGISSLIGQTEGTIFLEATFPDTQSGQVFMELSGTSPDINFQLTGGQFFFFSAGQWSISTAVSPNVKYKIAAAYKNNDIVLYINGVQRGTDTNATIAAKSNFYMNTRYLGDLPTDMRANQALLFKTRLDNATLQSLTTL
jgi:hypothetical protein